MRKLLLNKPEGVLMGSDGSATKINCKKISSKSLFTGKWLTKVKKNNNFGHKSEAIKESGQWNIFSLTQKDNSVIRANNQGIYVRWKDDLPVGHFGGVLESKPKQYLWQWIKIMFNSVIVVLSSWRSCSESFGVIRVQWSLLLFCCVLCSSDLMIANHSPYGSLPEFLRH